MIKNRLIPSALILTLALILAGSCQVGRYVFYNFADIKDYKKFPSRALHHSDSVNFRFLTGNNQKFPKEINQVPFDKFLAQHKTVAFLIIQHDTLRYERYFHGYSKENIVPSFSMAKSVTSILIGCAIDEGLIASAEEPVTNYVPELKKNGFEQVKIKHLLQMTSGLSFNESYVNPFGDAAAFYYGRNLRKLSRKMKLKAEPGKKFDYVSGNTQLLGLVLERSLKGKTITQYLQEKLWTPLGMEYDASWSIDKKKNGLEKTFCCLNARARDFAKIGRLYLNHGEWNGRQIVSKQWVETSTKADTTEGGAPYYRYQWWMPGNNGAYMAEGILGQYVYVNPAKDLIIVRLGRNEGKTDWWQLFQSMSSGY